jgi:site-specific DNA-cytosine methylase
LLAGGTEDYFDSAFAEDWDEEEPPVAFVVDGLLAHGMIHWASGKQSGLKSTVGAWAAREAMAQGRHVVWLDWEVGKPQARKRFRNVGITEQQASELMHYRYGPPIANTDDATVGRLRAQIEALDGPLVVLDSMSKALAKAGCNENDNGDVSRYTEALLQRAMKAAGATIYVIDHVGRYQAKASDNVAGGASTKDADADITYRFLVEEEPDHQTVGKLRILCQKDRDSVLSRGGLWQRSQLGAKGERWFEVGDGKGNLPVKPIEQPEEPQGRGGKCPSRSSHPVPVRER